MVLIMLAGFAMAAQAQGEIKVHSHEAIAAAGALVFDGRCPAGRLRLGPIGVTGTGATAPALSVAGRVVRGLPSGFTTFASKAGAAYRPSLACLPGTLGFRLQLFRAARIAAGVEYRVWTLDLSPGGEVTDRGDTAVEADGFWFR